MVSRDNCHTHGCRHATIVQFLHEPNVIEGVCSTPGKAACCYKSILPHACRHKPKHEVRKLQVVNAAGISADLACLRAGPSSPHPDSQQQQPCVALPLGLPNQRLQPPAFPLLLPAQAAQTRYSTHCLRLIHQHRANQRCLMTALVSQLLGHFPGQLLRHLLGLTYHHSCMPFSDLKSLFCTQCFAWMKAAILEVCKCCCCTAQQCLVTQFFLQIHSNDVNMPVLLSTSQNLCHVEPDAHLTWQSDQTPYNATVTSKLQSAKNNNSHHSRYNSVPKSNLMMW